MFHERSPSAEPLAKHLRASAIMKRARCSVNPPGGGKQKEFLLTKPRYENCMRKALLGGEGRKSRRTGSSELGRCLGSQDGGKVLKEGDSRKMLGRQKV